VLFDFSARELTIKLVYYGPALSGKTTNLQALHQLVNEASRGRMMTLETKDDRTLFFDMLPLTFRGGEMSLRVKLFTVPGQVIHVATRKLVLQGADGLAFIADSQLGETDNNRLSFLDLKNNLKANGLELKKMPLVIQYNKRDLPKVRPDKDLAEMAKQGREPVFGAIATKGIGVLETFFGLLVHTWTALDSEHGFASRFKLEGDDFMNTLAKQLGVTSDPKKLLESALGGFERAKKLAVDGGPKQ